MWALVAILRGRLWVVVLSAFLLAGLTAAFTLAVSPIYRATAYVLIEPSLRQPFDSPGSPLRGNDDAAAIESQAAMINSAAVLRPVVRQFDLASDEDFGSGGEPSLLSSIFGSSSKEADPVESEDDAVKALGKALTVKRQGLTYVIAISVDSTSPQKAADLAQGVAESFLDDAKRHKESVSVQITDQIEKRVEGLREQLVRAESAVQRFRAENQLQSTGENGLLLNQGLSEINTRLIEARAALAEKQALYDGIMAYLENGANADALDSPSIVSQSPRVAQLQEQYVLASREEANLETELLPQHPRLARARSEVARLRALLQAEVRSAAASARVELAIARDRVANLERAVESSRSQTNLGDAALVRLRELETEAQTTRALYENILGRAKEIAELDQVVIPNARVISPALAPDSPIWPKKKLLVALAGILGLLLGVVIAIGGTVAALVAEYVRGAAVAPAAEPEEEEPRYPAVAAGSGAQRLPPKDQVVAERPALRGGSLLNARRSGSLLNMDAG